MNNRISLSIMFTTLAQCLHNYWRGTYHVALYILAFLVLSITSLAHAITLEQAIRAALQTNPELGEAIENLRSSEQQINITESRFLPTIDFSSGAGYQYHDDGSTSAAESTRRGSNYDATVTLSQAIYDGGATTDEIIRNQAQALSSRHVVNETAESVALSAIQVYLQTLQERELTALAEDNVRRHQETLALVERKVAAGGATLSDVQTALFRLASAQNLLALAQSRLRDARATYKRTIGSLPSTMIRPAVPRELLPRNLQGAISSSIQNSPTVASARANIDAARKAIDITEAESLPTVNLSLSSSASRNQSTQINTIQKDATARIDLSYNLYDGGSNYHTVQQQTYNLGASRQAYNSAIRTTEETLRRAWAALIAARESVVSNKKENEAYAQVRNIFQKQFDTGTRTLLDVLQSEAQLYQSQVNLITAIYNEMFSSYRLLSSTGQLMAALNIITPDQPSFYAQGSSTTEAKQRQIFNNTLPLPGQSGSIPYYKPASSNVQAINPYDGYPVYAPEQSPLQSNLPVAQPLNSSTTINSAPTSQNNGISDDSNNDLSDDNLEFNLESLSNLNNIQDDNIVALDAIEPLNVQTSLTQPRRLPLQSVRQQPVTTSQALTNVPTEIITSEPFFPDIEPLQNLGNNSVSQLGVNNGLARSPTFGIDAAAIARDSNQRQAEAYARALQQSQTRTSQADTSFIRRLPEAPAINSIISAPPPAIFSN